MLSLEQRCSIDQLCFSYLRVIINARYMGFLTLKRAKIVVDGEPSAPIPLMLPSQSKVLINCASGLLPFVRHPLGGQSRAEWRWEREK